MILFCISGCGLIVFSKAQRRPRTAQLNLDYQTDGDCQDKVGVKCLPNYNSNIKCYRSRNYVKGATLLQSEVKFQKQKWWQKKKDVMQRCLCGGI